MKGTYERIGKDVYPIGSLGIVDDSEFIVFDWWPDFEREAAEHERRAQPKTKITKGPTYRKLEFSQDDVIGDVGKEGCNVWGNLPYDQDKERREDITDDLKRFPRSE